MRVNGDKVLFGEPLQGLAHGGAGHVEAFGNVLFLNRRARRQLKPDNGAAQISYICSALAGARSGLTGLSGFR